jgi:RND family efflux transporter MFP subunit
MRRLSRLLWLLPLLALAGCKGEQAPAPDKKPPEVDVARPVVRDVTDFEVFTGHTESENFVNVKARVSGQLVKVEFKDGDVVDKDQRLFLIDPRPFAAAVKENEAALAEAKARVDRIKFDWDQERGLLNTGSAGSAEKFRQLTLDLNVAQTAIGGAEARLSTARLNLEWTEVRAPFKGRVSRRMMDPGNIVKADDTVLTTIVALSPVYAYFDVDERTVLARMMHAAGQRRRWWSGGRSTMNPLSAARAGGLPVTVGLVDEPGLYPHRARINFVDNHVETGTGTLWLRAVFTDRWYSPMTRPIGPGLFIRVHLPLGQPYEAILVAEKALGSDQGQRFLYVVKDDGTAEYRKVEVGRQHGNMRVIKAWDEKTKTGLRPDEHVVWRGLQRVRPGGKVTPHLTKMPENDDSGLHESLSEE